MGSWSQDRRPRHPSPIPAVAIPPPQNRSMKVCLRPGVVGRHYTSSGRSFKPQGKLAVCHGVSPARQRVNTGRTLQSMFLAGITPKKPTRCSGNAPNPASAPACWQPDVPHARRRPTWRPRQDAAYEASGRPREGLGGWTCSSASRELRVWRAGGALAPPPNSSATVSGCCGPAWVSAGGRSPTSPG